MAVDFHNQDDKFKKQQISNPEVTQTNGQSSVVPSEPKAPNSVMDNTASNTGTVSKEGFVKSDESAEVPKIEDSVDDELAFLLSNEANLTPEQKARLEELKEQSLKASEKATADGQKNQALPPEKERKLDEYSKVRSMGNTAYEKTSKVMDKYLSENDPKYQKLKTEQEKRRYRDSLIHDLQAIVNPKIKNENLSISQRKEGLARIADLYIMSAVSGKSIETLTSVGAEVLEKNFSEHNKIMFLKMADSIGLEDNSISVDEKINRLAELMLKNDDKYHSLSGKDKKLYRDNKVAEFVSNELQMDISSKMLDTEDGKIIKAGLIEFLKEYKNAGDFGIDSLSPKRTAIALKNAISKNMELYSPEMKERAKQLCERCDIIADLCNKGKDVPTEEDVYAYLLNKGENRSETENSLLATYQAVIDSGYNLKGKEASIRSITAKSLLTNFSDTQVVALSVKQVLKNSNKSEILSGKSKQMKALAKEIQNTKEGTKAFNALMRELEAHFSPEEMKKVKELYNINSDFAYAHESLKKVKNIDEIKQTEMYSAKYGTENDKKNIANIAKNTHKGWNKEEQAAYMTDVHNEEIIKYASEIIDGANYGFNHAPNRSNEDLTYVQDQIQNSNLSDNYKEFSVKSMTSNATAEQQKHIINYYENTTDKNIIKGLAAAEPNIHESVKKEYSEKLDRIIEHNGLQNDRDIQIARETGQTSNERAQASENTRSEATSSENRTASSSVSSASSSASSTSGTKVQGARITVSTIYISPEAKSSAREVKATLAQLDSENKKADAMKKIADNIEKIQKEAIKYEQKAEQKRTIEEQKQKAEEIKKENEKKTEEQLKDELSASLDSSIEEIQNELPQTPEAAEVKKLFGDMYNDLKSYAQAGQIDQVFALLGKIPKAQEKFLEKLATKHLSTIAHFIKGADKSILKFMCEKNPGIISTLDTNTLMTLCNSGFPKSMIIKYGEKNQVASMLTDLQLASTKETLSEFYEVMGISKSEQDTVNASEVVKKNGNVKGDDDHMAKLLENMKKASNDIASTGIQATVVPNWKEPDKKVPRELWG